MRSRVLFSVVVTCAALGSCTGTVENTHSTVTGGAAGSGGATSTGGSSAPAGTGGSTSSGGQTGAGGGAGLGGAQGAGGATPDAGGSLGIDGGVTVDCTATLPTGGTTNTGTNVNGTADGLNYGIWTNGSGGNITVFPNAHAFSASWDNSMDFLAHVGLDFNTAKDYTTYGTISAQFSEIKTGTSGSFSSIGMYGWMHSPCIEWYINEDSYSGLRPRGSVTAVIDGETYYLTTSTTNGTGGANACEAGHTGGWTNITSTRATGISAGRSP